MERRSQAYDDPRSARSPEFRSTVERWLSSTDDVLVLNRLTRAAGRKDWYLIRTLTDLDVVVDRARPSDCLTAFAGRHLPHRGRADDRLLRTVLDVVAANEESVLGEEVDGDPELRDALAAVPEDADWVEEWIRDHWGRAIAFGPYPPFLSDDTDVAVDGIVPSPDGSVIVGVY